MRGHRPAPHPGRKQAQRLAVKVRTTLHVARHSEVHVRNVHKCLAANDESHFAHEMRAIPPWHIPRDLEGCGSKPAHTGRVEVRAVAAGRVDAVLYRSMSRAGTPTAKRLDAESVGYLLKVAMRRAREAGCEIRGGMAGLTTLAATVSGRAL